ncbi:hypothetical protein [Streptomyces sp. NPDC002133]|uniref:hypothetical protein n=1 Tax=Streptomyces sp. NPDC002133 TaxID=3154409 RepID=UPI003328B44C
MTHWAELEVLLAPRHNGIGMVSWDPLKGGVLGGALRRRKEGTAVRGVSGRSARTLAGHHNVSVV